jgi:4-phospho-D-threonate 3-dehydrogenase / 4-phospho-D-erythronate 3-dehydrogenase
MEQYRPTLGITMGDPCGIGAEITVRALADVELRRRARFVIFGLSEQLAYTADCLEIEFPFHRQHHEDVRRFEETVVVLDYDEFSMPPAMPRGPSRPGGQASMAFCLDAIAAARAGLIDAIVTAPVSKTSWEMARFRKYPGHTELLADKCNVRDVAMMFVAPQLKVVLATIHISVAEIRNRFTIGCVFNPIDLADKALREWFGVPAPRIGVCGLNPHAGEEGRFGDDEARIIAPAILMAAETGINVTGPFPADTIFLKALEGKFDCVVAMYHDQGLIPVKLLAFDEAVNVTLGTPIIRTSPDHGTAFDIVGKNRANPGSMRSAIEMAVDLARKSEARRQQSEARRQKPEVREQRSDPTSDV